MKIPNNSTGSVAAKARQDAFAAMVSNANNERESPKCGAFNVQQGEAYYETKISDDLQISCSVGEEEM